MYSLGQVIVEMKNARPRYDEQQTQNKIVKKISIVDVFNHGGVVSIVAY